MKCINCKFFFLSDSDPRTSICQKILHPNEMGEVWFEEMMEKEGIPHNPKARTPEQEMRFERLRNDKWNSMTKYRNESIAYVEDASSYYARLYVKPDFGCVLFKENN